MAVKIPEWEAELWSYLGSGDGAQCPVYYSCRPFEKNISCLSNQAECREAMNEFIDNDDSNIDIPEYIKCPDCPKNGRIFKLIRMLANSYLLESGINRIPVPIDLINQDDDKLAIEIRQVPLKAHYGAVWRLNDCWLIHLNSNTTRARQRFTLYHEIFHILAHRKTTPVFKKIACSQMGSFNEMLADHFAAAILTPFEWVEKIWPQVNDINQTAAIFDVPRPIMQLALRHLGLI